MSDRMHALRLYEHTYISIVISISSDFSVILGSILVFDLAWSVQVLFYLRGRIYLNTAFCRVLNNFKCASVQLLSKKRKHEQRDASEL